MQLIGKSKIGNLSAKGIKYPQVRLPKRYLDTVGKTANIYETEHDGKQAFLIVTEHSMPKEGTVLKPCEQVLKPCPDVAQSPPDIIAKNEPDSTEPLTTDSRSKSIAESFII